MADINRQILLDQIPQGRLGREHFRFNEATVPKPGDGELLVCTRYISLDAANRAWMSGATYRAALSAGQLMAGGALAEVRESRAPGFAPGDLVFADTGWQEYAVLPARHLIKLQVAEPITYLLSVYGVAGLTAYFGLLECGRPKPGDTVVVSAAAGSVGMIVGQIAKIKGCRTVGIAGGAAKCALLTEELGFDKAVDYKAGDTLRALRAASPDGIDVYFDNVGGPITDAVFLQINTHARMSICGQISQYNNAKPEMGPRLLGMLIVARAKAQGFLVTDYYPRFGEALKEMAGWLQEGKLTYREDIVEGFENLPKAFIGLFHGENTGKRIVKVVD
jgi:NADPH-dependent curcumin reductase CurA